MNKIVNSSVSTRAIIYKNVRLIDCSILPLCCVGDDCDAVSCHMEERSEIGRRNVIRNTTIGFGTYTGTNCIIKNATIGNYTCIGWDVSIGGGNHNINNVSMYTDYWYSRTFGIKKEELEKKENEVALPVVIGSDVWIGSGVIILNGVTIGDGAVIGAGAVVTSNVAPFSVMVGVPAKEIKKRFDKDIIDLLLKVKWWNWDFEILKKHILFLRNPPTVEELKKFLINKK